MHAGGGTALLIPNVLLLRCCQACAWCDTHYWRTVVPEAVLSVQGTLCGNHQKHQGDIVSSHLSSPAEDPWLVSPFFSAEESTLQRTIQNNYNLPPPCGYSPYSAAPLCSCRGDWFCSSPGFRWAHLADLVNKEAEQFPVEMQLC